MEEKPNYYAIIPAEVRYDNDLRAGAKIFYGEITALCSKYGVCTASNNYFADLYQVTTGGISQWVTQLKNKGYIDVQYEKEGKQIIGRKIILRPFNTSNEVVERVLTNVNRVFTNVDGGIYKNKEGYLQKVKDNNIKDNNTSINNNSSRKKFTKPTIEEIQKYIDDNNLNVNANNFYDYYESNGWKVGHNSMKSYQATLRRWSRNNKGEEKRPSWIDKEIKREEATDEELKELDKLLEDFK